MHSWLLIFSIQDDLIGTWSYHKSRSVCGRKKISCSSKNSGTPVINQHAMSLHGLQAYFVQPVYCFQTLISPLEIRNITVWSSCLTCFEKSVELGPPWVTHYIPVSVRWQSAIVGQEFPLVRARIGSADHPSSFPQPSHLTGLAEAPKFKKLSIKATKTE